MKFCGCCCCCSSRLLLASRKEEEVVLICHLELVTVLSSSLLSWIVSWKMQLQLNPERGLVLFRGFNQQLHHCYCLSV